MSVVKLETGPTGLASMRSTAKSEYLMLRTWYIPSGMRSLDIVNGAVASLEDTDGTFKQARLVFQI